MEQEEIASSNSPTVQEPNTFFVKLFRFVKYSVALPYFNGLMIGLGEFAVRFSTFKLRLTKEDPILTFVNPSAIQERLKLMEKVVTKDIQNEGVVSKLKTFFGKLFKK